MSGEYFFLFLEDVGDLFLESKVFFSDVVIFKSGLHNVDIFFHFFLVDFVKFGIGRYLFLDLLFNALIVLFFAVYTVAFNVTLVFLRFADKRKVRLLFGRS